VQEFTQPSLLLFLACSTPAPPRTLNRASLQYHKEWNFVWDRQVRAAELISDLPAAFARAGLVTSKLKNMTASNRRALAREVGQMRWS
jgi:hypothetical protein